MKRQSSTRGFIALISSLIISVALLALAASLSLTSLFTRFNTLEGEYKKVSFALAQACAEQALLNVSHNHEYGGDEEVWIDADMQGIDEVCRIEPIHYVPSLGYDTLGNKEVTIQTRGRYRNTFTSIRAEAIIHDPAVSSNVSVPNVRMTRFEEISF